MLKGVDSFLYTCGTTPSAPPRPHDPPPPYDAPPPYSLLHEHPPRGTTRPSIAKRVTTMGNKPGSSSTNAPAPPTPAPKPFAAPKRVPPQPPASATRRPPTHKPSAAERKKIQVADDTDSSDSSLSPETKEICLRRAHEQWRATMAANRRAEAIMAGPVSTGASRWTSPDGQFEMTRGPTFATPGCIYIGGSTMTGQVGPGMHRPGMSSGSVMIRGRDVYASGATMGPSWSGNATTVDHREMEIEAAMHDYVQQAIVQQLKEQTAALRRRHY